MDRQRIKGREIRRRRKKENSFNAGIVQTTFTDMQ